MKTNLFIFATVAILSANNSLRAQNIIHSTTNGGLWPNNTTWIEQVPSNGDSVILQGPVSMLSYTGWCKSLNITPDGSLGGNGNQGTLYIYGSFYNNGLISGSMNYVLTGNIENNQPWNGVDNHLLFTGTDHSISCAPGAGINAQLEVSDSLQNFTLMSDVTLNTTSATNLGFSQLDAGNHKLHIASGQFNNCRLHSSDTLQIESYVSSLDISGDYKLTGNMTFYYNMVLNEKATNYGTIHFASGVGGDPLKLKGDFINEGTMAHAWVQVEKNIMNHGTWQTENTEFKGTGDKHISQSDGNPFGGTQFTSDNSVSMIILDSDVEFTVPSFHLYNNTLKCGLHTLTANTVFYDGTIISETEIKGNNDFWNSTLKGNVVLSGTSRFSNSTSDGVIENTGLMKDITFYGGWFKSYNHLINNNSIQSLSIRVFGNLTNYGTIDNNSIIEIAGNVTQYISLLHSIESPTHFISDISGTSYTWMKNGNDIPNSNSSDLLFSTLQLSDAGVYKCRVVTGTGETVYSRDVIVNNVTSVPDNKLAGDLQVFPNPFNENTTIKWEQESNETIRIDLTDINGKLIQKIANSSFPAGNNEIKLNVNNTVKPGIYMLRFISGSEAQTRKLIYSR